MAAPVFPCGGSTRETHLSPRIERPRHPHSGVHAAHPQERGGCLHRPARNLAATSPRLSGDDDEKRLRPGDPLLLPFLGCDVIGRAVVLRLPEPALCPRTRTHAGTATNGAGACGTGPGSLGMGRRAAAVGRTLSTHAVVEAKVFAGRYYSPAGSTTGDL